MNLPASHFLARLGPSASWVIGLCGGCISAIPFLWVLAADQANSTIPTLTLGCAPFLVSLWLARRWVESAQLALNSEEKRVRQDNRDTLTGLHNRAGFETQIRREISRTERYGEDMVVLLVDIESFKALNLERGQAVGNYVLQKLAEATQNAVRDIDFVCRFDGDQLALILPQTDAVGAESLATRLLGDVAGGDWVFDHRPLQPRLCIAGVQLPGYQTAAFDTLIAELERNLGRAKSGGGQSILIKPVPVEVALAS